MALGTFSGKGFLLSDGIELKFSTNGSAWARLPLVFKNDHLVDGKWVSDKEFRVDGTVFGALAEFLANEVTGRQDLNVSGQLYTEEYSTKDGEKKTAVRLQVFSAAPAGAPRVKAAAASSSFADSDVPF